MSLAEFLISTAAITLILAQVGIRVGISMHDRRIEALEEQKRVSEAAHQAVAAALFNGEGG